ATWPHDRLVLGASRLIREADRALPGKRVRVHANRGLAGIDGTISTGLGIALASQAGSGSAAAGITRVLVGDLTLLHDVGSLLIGTGERVPRIQVIVGNDGGGTIFDGLEVANTAAPAAIDRVMFTPQRVDLASLAKAYGWTHLRAATHGELEAALTTASGAPLLIEVPLVR
ncbi:thiamine pyrophosphate-dependent enzyme, partial [Clavibacter michiganensis]